VKLQHRVAVAAPPERVWDLFMDIPAVASCVPGVEELVPIDADHFRGRYKIGLGPIRLALEGELEIVSRDDQAGRAELRASGADRRLGGAVRALITLSIERTGTEARGDGSATGAGSATASGPTTVIVDSDVQVLGRIGELGQPIMKRKADEVMRSFAVELARRLE
jgi:carbon monoxide dehydrogenase subunit G